MADKLNINLDRTLTSLRIISVVAGALITCAVVYGSIDGRMDKIEQDQATFKGIMDERTRNTQIDVKRIYDIVKEWEKE